MAVVQLAPLVSEIKGKIGGVVFQTSRYGQIIKINNFRGSNPTGTRGIVDTNTKGTNSWWGSLTLAQQDAWAAASIDFPTVDRYGNPIISTGYNFFQRNALLFPPSAGFDPTTIPTFIGDGTSYDTQATLTGGNMRCAWERTVGAGSAYLIVDSTPASRSTILKAPNRWRRLFQGDIAPGPAVQVVTTQYNNIWGVPTPGGVVFIRMRIYARRTCQLFGSGVFRLVFT